VRDYNSVSILLPTKGRQQVLLNSLLSLSETQGARDLLEIIIVADDDPESFEIASDFHFQYRFKSYRVFLSPERLYPVNAFILAYSLCASRYFASMNDENTYKSDWLLKALDRFDKEFPDKIGVLSLYDIRKSGLMLTTQDFVRYNENEWWNKEYKLYYADDEFTMRAILLGRYAFQKNNGVFHDIEITKRISAIPWEEKIAIKKVDRGLFYKRSESNFGLPVEKIYKWEGLREINLSLKGEIK